MVDTSSQSFVIYLQNMPSYELGGQFPTIVIDVKELNIRVHQSSNIPCSELV